MAMILRLFMSSRSLHRECVSLMSPSAARKSSKAVNDPAMIGFSTDWMQIGPLLCKEGFFSHIGRGSVSVHNVLTRIEAAYKKEGYEQAPALSYTIHCIALQSLVDLNREVKYVKFILDEAELKNSSATLVDFAKEVEDVGIVGERPVSYHFPQRNKKGSLRKLYKLLKELRKEASSLVSFMVGNFHHLHMNCSSSSQIKNCKGNDRCRMKAERNHDQCDLVLSRFKEKSLAAEFWSLLCRNIDIWAEYASESDIKNFIYILLRIPLQGNLDQMLQLRGCIGTGLEDTPAYFTGELFRDSQFYEQKAVRGVFVASLCHELEDALTSINQDGTLFSFSKRSVNALNGSALSHWKGWENLICMIDKKVGVIEGLTKPHSSGDGLEMMKLDDLVAQACDSAVEEEVKIDDTGPADQMDFVFNRCINLLNLVSWLPKGYLDANGAATCTDDIIELERFILWHIIEMWSFFSSPKGQTSVCSTKILQHLEFFMACRRALGALALENGTADLGQRTPSSLNKLSSSCLWVLLSIPAVATCSLDLLAQSLDDSVVTAAENVLTTIVSCTTGLFTFVSEDLVNNLLQSHLLLPENKTSDRRMPVESEYDMAIESLTKTLGMHMRNVVDYGKEMKLDYSVDISDISALMDGTLNKNLQIERVKDLYKISASAAAARSLLWSITTFVDSMDQKCHLDKTGSTKWSGELPTPLLSYVQDMELLVMCGMQYLLPLNYTGRSSQIVLDDLKGRCQTVVKSGGPSFGDKLCETRVDLGHSVEEIGTGGGEQTVGESNDENRNLGEPYKRGSIGIEEDKRHFELEEVEEEFCELRDGSRKKMSLTEESTTPPGVLSEFLEMSSLQKSILSSLLLGNETKQAKLLGELFMAMAAVVRLKSLYCSPNMTEPGVILFDRSWTSSISLHIGAAYSLMSEATALAEASFHICLSLLLGAVKYMECIGSFLPYVRPTLSPLSFVKVVEVHVAMFGAVIALTEGNVEKLEDMSTSNCFPKGIDRSNKVISQQTMPYGGKALEELMGALRSSFTMLLKKPLTLHLRIALQTVERAVLGFDGNCFKGCGLEAGNLAGMKVRSSVAAGVECLSLCLDAISGQKRLQLLGKYCTKFLAAIFNLIAYCQAAFSGHAPALPDGVKHHTKVFETRAVDADPVLLKCIEILGGVASREAIFSMKPNLVAQAMQCPAIIFKPLYELKMPQYRLLQSLSAGIGKSKSHDCPLDSGTDRCETSMKVYVACCKLLRSLLHHRRRESGHCIALLEDSVRVLLFVLEVSKQSTDILTNEAAVNCAGWLRRVYEEIAEQKEILGKYCGYILSDYICVISGYGVTMAGLDRDVDVSLRPGAYALVDACSADVLQQLHAVLGEGPRRSALLALRRDYERHFKYTGKV